MIILGVSSLLVILLLIFLRVDNKYWRNNRILNNDWEFDRGYYIAGMICGKCSEISNDTLFLNKENKVIIKYQYFHTLKVKDIKSQKETRFTAIGSYRWE